MEEFSRNSERGLAWISQKQYWRTRRKGIIGKIFKKFGEGLCGFPKSNIGGRKLRGNVSRNWESGFAWICRKQHRREEIIGGFFYKFLRGFPKSNIGGRKTIGERC